MSTSGRRIVVSEFISLDGVIEDPSWTFPYWNDEIAAFKGAETEAAEALLLGRRTYEMFAAAWPDSPDPGAPVINALPKHVATRSETHAELDAGHWNARRLPGDAVEAVRSLRAAPGGDLLVWGSATLARDLLRHGLVDELRLVLYPVVLGEGLRLFGYETASLRLVEARPFATGATGLVYAPADPS